MDNAVRKCAVELKEGIFVGVRRWFFFSLRERGGLTSEGGTGDH